jgi:hypothetical protein
MEKVEEALSGSTCRLVMGYHTPGAERFRLLPTLIARRIMQGKR